MHYLVVGLGNPGKKYERTRHNAGFMVVDALARELHAAEFKFKKSLNALITECQIGDTSAKCQVPSSIILAKPQTFMNLSGQSVAALISKFRQLKVENIDTLKSLLVISDDLDLPFGAIRYRGRGSAGGHNGLKSVIKSLGTNEFPRLKIGIRPPEAARQPGKAEDFVLERFSAEELALFKGSIIPQAMRLICEKIRPATA